jgi:uncharacterized damage-inducible protein DinB
MGMTDALVGELTREAVTTRKVLERVPDDKMSWRPHPKSMTLGELAYHVAYIPHAIADLLSADGEVPNRPRHQAASAEELVTTLDESVPYAAAKLQAWGDEGLGERWAMKRNGRTLMEMPRVGMVRAVMFNHLYHHRGQLTVYLRLLDVALPSVYGPSADDNPFA